MVPGGFPIKKLSLFLSLAAMVCAQAVALPAGAPVTQLPNVAFILADDLGYGDLSCYDQTKDWRP